MQPSREAHAGHCSGDLGSPTHTAASWVSADFTSRTQSPWGSPGPAFPLLLGPREEEASRGSCWVLALDFPRSGKCPAQACLPWALGLGASLSPLGCPQGSHTLAGGDCHSIQVSGLLYLLLLVPRWTRQRGAGTGEEAQLRGQFKGHLPRGPLALLSTSPENKTLPY